MARYWIALLIVLVVGFGVLGMYEPRIRSTMPPIPERVISDDGRTVLDGAAIRRGQEVWQSIGGQEVGTIWGHGSYVAPDWGADWLHREAVFVLDAWAARARSRTARSPSSGRRRCASGSR
jgi:nitric oxide reductase subunit B